VDFEKDLKGNLYKIWNRMSSGSYFLHQYGSSDTEGQRRAEGIGVPTVGIELPRWLSRSTLNPKWSRFFIKTLMAIGQEMSD
jgi:hypothetical protein